MTQLLRLKLENNISPGKQLKVETEPLGPGTPALGRAIPTGPLQQTHRLPQGPRTDTSLPRRRPLSFPDFPEKRVRARGTAG